MSTIQIRALAPGITAQVGVNLTPVEIRHYAQLRGRVIREVMFVDFEGRDHIPTLVLDDGTQVAILCDPEGNGPGWCDIFKP